MDTLHSPKKMSRLLQMPGFVRFGIRIDSAAPWRWLALLAIALWPAWWRMGWRMVDGTDDPLGALALVALVATLWHNRARLRAAPRLGYQFSALALAVLTTALHNQAPDLLVALGGMASLTAGAMAFLPAHVAGAPVLGMSILALPVLAPLQTYLADPLDTMTAEASRWALAAAHTVERSGANLLIDGHRVLLDAPCSGMQLAWLGLFTACAAALAARRTGRAFLMHLPMVGVLLLLGNILRTTVQLALQTAGVQVPHALQWTIGLLVVATVCAAIAGHMRFTPPCDGQPTP